MGRGRKSKSEALTYWPDKCDCGGDFIYRMCVKCLSKQEMRATEAGKRHMKAMMGHLAAMNQLGSNKIGGPL